jgi:hypothetical protein
LQAWQTLNAGVLSPEFQKLKSLQQQSSTYIESFAIEGAQ